MVIPSTASLDLVPSDESALYLGVSGGSGCRSDCVELDIKICSLYSCCRKESCLLDHEPTLPVSYKNSSLAVNGKWICSTDLLQTSPCKKRPRLLPRDIKMYTFIPHGTESLQETSVSGLQGDLSAHKLVNIRNSLRNIKRHFKLTTLHPKKHFLNEYLLKQQTC
ncbi:hypothetical protein XENTR_v10024510 [Xenopus tropicalis]|uniref:Uncharacterized protein LOC100487186 n=1 Tax=Xenopus tropicalis TaxID=8364 RepID=A0A8J0QKC5_XENTR|nr:uncharacterized protein LOC100487186 [Xenopus tropicalis]KAE8580717.1 hypothetical protein XENTR_v10024510 [Xenopus tropicalis]